ncbi:MmyB family transcriptional regulator [Streptomyces sp. NPDC055722]
MRTLTVTSRSTLGSAWRLYSEADHQNQSRASVAVLRATVARPAAKDAEVNSLIASLLHLSPEFAELWAHHDMAIRHSDRKRLVPPHSARSRSTASTCSARKTDSDCSGSPPRSAPTAGACWTSSPLPAPRNAPSRRADSAGYGR